MVTTIMITTTITIINSSSWHKRIRAPLWDALIFVPYVLEELLLLCVSLIELVNTTSCIHELHLTCVEWVRCV